MGQKGEKESAGTSVRVPGAAAVHSLTRSFSPVFLAELGPDGGVS